MENIISISLGDIYFGIKIGEIVAWILLALYLIINISGIREIEKKKYPTKVFYIVIPLMIIQTLSLLCSEGNIGYPFLNEGYSGFVFYAGMVAYYIGYFITGIASTLILFFYIQHWDKVTNNIDK